MSNKILYWAPRVLSLLFVAFLCLFSLDGFTEYKGWETILALLIHLSVPIIVLLATIWAWKKDLVGTVMFFGFAIYYVYTVGLNRHWSWYVAISGPAVVIGILFLIDWIKKYKLSHK
ncbi:MAG TPA: hypothetical protein PK367_02160 [Candidatus Paceibacterota bacterium]|nr:hypothetical protein [Candidatus Paceibacterota bacterium]